MGKWSVAEASLSQFLLGAGGGLGGAAFIASSAELHRQKQRLKIAAPWFCIVYSV